MSNRFQPQLSAKIFSTKSGETELNLAKLRFPLQASIKYDGIRLLEYNGGMVTRSLKPLRNHYAHAMLRGLIAAATERKLKGLDGEIICGALNDPNAMQNTQSGVMTYEGEPEFTFLLFDTYQYGERPFGERYERLQQFYRQVHGQFPWLLLVEQVTIHNLEDLLAYEAEVVAMGYEGIMVRSPEGHYKMGRSTMNQQNLMALKRFVDDEALVLEYREELENANPATENLLGHTQRSGHRENFLPKGRMGTMLCRSLKFDDPFFLGGGRGITHEFRQLIWDNPQNFQWQVANYVYQDIGIRSRPRLPRWKAFRSVHDMDPRTVARLLQLGDGHVCSPEGVCAVLAQFRPKVD